MRTWFKILFIAAGVVGAVLLVLRLVFFDVWTVPIDDPMLAASIEPTLTAGDVVVLTQRTEVARGNLLRCDNPQAPGRYVVVRAIGRFGDRVDVAAEVVSIDGHRNPSPRACDPSTMVIHDPQSNEDDTLSCSIEEYGETTYAALRSADHPEPPQKVTVEPGKWYLLSDNRHVHVDSRDFGQIETSSCRHIVYRIVSAQGVGDSRKRFSMIW